MNPAPFTGWVRTGGAWRAACVAATEAECWRLLLAIPAAEKLVNRGRHPEKRKRPR